MLYTLSVHRQADIHNENSWWLSTGHVLDFRAEAGGFSGAFDRRCLSCKDDDVDDDVEGVFSALK